MVKKNFSVTKVAVLFICLTLCPCVSAQTHSGSTSRTTESPNAGEAIVNGIKNILKKKEHPDKDQQSKASKAEKTSKKSSKDGNSKSTTEEKQTKEKKKQIAKNDDDIELVVSGDGNTKEAATLSALRSALEQAYGTFVSSNTTLLNDELVKDEIVSVSAGNIKHYDYIAEREADGKYYITLKAIVSVGKLIQYVKSKGGETELEGAAFTMDIKLKRLQIQNEEKVIDHLMIQLEELVPQMLDYSIEVGSPERSGGGYRVPACITFSTNENYNTARDLIWNTLNALYIKNEEDLKDFKSKMGGAYAESFYTFEKSSDLTHKVLTQTNNVPLSLITDPKFPLYYFRTEKFFNDFGSLIANVMYHFIIEFISNDGTKVPVEVNLKRYSDDDISFISDVCSFRTKYFNSRLYEKEEINQPTMGRCSHGFFPIEKSSQWKIHGSIGLSEEMLERTKKINVLASPLTEEYLIKQKIREILTNK